MLPLNLRWSTQKLRSVYVALYFVVGRTLQIDVLTFFKEYIKGRDHILPNQSLLLEHFDLCERKYLHLEHLVPRPHLYLLVAPSTRRNLNNILKSSSNYEYLTNVLDCRQYRRDHYKRLMERIDNRMYVQVTDKGRCRDACVTVHDRGPNACQI